MRGWGAWASMIGFGMLVGCAAQPSGPPASTTSQTMELTRTAPPMAAIDHLGVDASRQPPIGASR